MAAGIEMLNELAVMIGDRHPDCELLSGLVVSRFKSRPGFRAVMFRTDTGKWTIGDFRPDQIPEFRTWIEKMT